MATPGIFGIVNLTRDSFSDGGRYLEPERALARARELVADGADVVDLGAESTHPDSEDVSSEEELRRLEPVVPVLVEEGLQVSVDTHRPATMRRVLELGAHWINDVSGLADPESIAVLRDSDCRVVVMHNRSRTPRADRAVQPSDDIVAEIAAWFAVRAAQLAHDGIARERIVLDPGMGFFLDARPGPSLTVLRELERLRELGLPLLLGTSRKSFLGATVGREPEERGAATLASELWAATRGVDWIRTHDVRALADGLATWRAIRGDDPPV